MRVMTKHYPSELKERAVRLVLDAEGEQPGGRRGACTRVGAQLGVNADTLRGWVVQFEVNQGGRPGVKTADAQRIRELERENRELRRSNAILKTASAFFAAELDRPQPK
jgi:transposase